MSFKDYLDNGFIKYDESDLVDLYTNNKDSYEFIIARLLACFEDNYSFSYDFETRLELMRFVESNIFMDLINNRFDFNEYTKNKLMENIDIFKGCIEDDIFINTNEEKESLLLSLSEKDISFNDYILFKEYYHKCNDKQVYKRERNIDESSLQRLNVDVDNILLSNNFIEYSKEENKILNINVQLFNNDIEYVSINPSKEINNICNTIMNSNKEISILFKDKIRNKNTSFRFGGSINIDSFINSNKFLFGDYSKQVCRSTYYLDILLDAFNFSLETIGDSLDIAYKNFIRPISLGISLKNENILDNISTDESILKMLFTDIMSYLNMYSLLTSCRIVTVFGKNKFDVRHANSFLSYIKDMKLENYYTTNASLEILEIVNKYISSNRDDNYLLNILKSLYTYNAILYKEVVKCLIDYNIRNCRLIDIDLNNKLFYNNYVFLKSIYPYVDGVVNTYIEFYNDIDYIKNKINEAYNNGYINCIIFKKNNEVDSIIDSNKEDSNNLKDALSNSSTEELISIFRDNANIFNKVFGCLVESGRSANIINYEDNNYKHSISGISSFINVKSPYGRILFSGNFDRGNKLREVLITLDSNQDKELNNFMNTLSRLISIILQESSDYKKVYNELCIMLRGLNNFTTEFIYESNRILNKKYTITNICELVSYVLPELEYIYLLNKYSDPNLANEYMIFKNGEC